MDFFTVPTITFGVLYFFIISHDRRRILHANITKPPTSGWIIQQLREAFPFEASHKYLIFDRDQKFGFEVIAAVNAKCESFFRTLEREEVGAKEYRDLEDLRLNISAFIECYYNRIRLHSALGYRPPAKFERLTVSSDAANISSTSKLELVTREAR